MCRCERQEMLPLLCCESGRSKAAYDSLHAAGKPVRVPAGNPSWSPFGCIVIFAQDDTTSLTNRRMGGLRAARDLSA